MYISLACRHAACLSPGVWYALLTQAHPAVSCIAVHDTLTGQVSWILSLSSLLTLVFNDLAPLFVEVLNSHIRGQVYTYISLVCHLLFHNLFTLCHAMKPSGCRLGNSVKELFSYIPQRASSCQPAGLLEYIHTGISSHSGSPHSLLHRTGSFSHVLIKLVSDEQKKHDICDNSPQGP